MENNNELDLKEPNISVAKLNEKIDQIREYTVDNREVKEMFDQIDDENKSVSQIADLFYKSVQLIFDTGFDLAKKLNLDLFESFKFDDSKAKNK